MIKLTAAQKRVVEMIHEGVDLESLTCATGYSKNSIKTTLSAISGRLKLRRGLSPQAVIDTIRDKHIAYGTCHLSDNGLRPYLPPIKWPDYSQHEHPRADRIGQMVVIWIKAA